MLTDAALSEKYLRKVFREETFDLRETFVVVLLATSLEVIGWVRIAEGGIEGVTVDPRLVFGVALATASAAIVVAHNHPSGGVTPSAVDIAFTKRLANGAELLGIRFVDHIILGRHGAFAFSGSGYL